MSVGILLTAYLYVFMPLSNWFQSRQEQLVAKQAAILHISEVIRATPKLQNQLSISRGRASDGTLLLTGDSDSAAAANLQSLIKMIAMQNHIELANTSFVPDESVNSLEKITVEESFSATWPALVRLLNAINNATPPLVVTDLTIDGSQQTQQSDVETSLQISCSISGFWRDGSL